MVSQKSDWAQWIRFFLQAANTQAQKAVENIRQLQMLGKEYRKILEDAKQPKSTHHAINHLFSSPYTTIPHMAADLGITYQTAKTHIKNLEKAGIMKNPAASCEASQRLQPLSMPNSCGCLLHPRGSTLARQLIPNVPAASSGVCCLSESRK